MQHRAAASKGSAAYCGKPYAVSGAEIFLSAESLHQTMSTCDQVVGSVYCCPAGGVVQARRAHASGFV